MNTIDTNIPLVVSLLYLMNIKLKDKLCYSIEYVKNAYGVMQSNPLDWRSKGPEFETQASHQLIENI